MLNKILRSNITTPALKAATTATRGLATPVSHPSLLTHVLPPKNAAALYLKSGQSYHGQAFGSTNSKFGETVFSTSITSYTDSMTDPSYLGQILVFTSPMIGNYGVPNNAPLPETPGIPFLESQGVQCAGVVVSDVALKYSHYKAVESLHEWCARYDVPGLTGVDTRAITSLLRDQGTTLGRLAIGDDALAGPPAEFWDPSKENLIARVSTPQPYTLNPNGKGPKIAVLDFGSKANILRSLVKRDAVVTVLPWNFDFNAVRDQYDGLFLSNGPGDPKSIMDTVERVRITIQEWNKPIFGICMGHQIIGLAAGLEAYRMTFGNRGHNQPVLALASSGSIKAGRVYVTASLTVLSSKCLANPRARTTSTRSSSLRTSRKDGRRSSSTATTRRSRVSSPHQSQASESGECSSTRRVRVDRLTRSR